MSSRRPLLTCLPLLLMVPQLAAAAEHAEPLDVPAWAVLPFVLLLLSIALLPIVAGHFWHNNARKALVALILSGPVVAYLVHLEQTTGAPALARLTHALLDYADFIVLLTALYTVAGGIVVSAHFRPGPAVNAAFLLLGAVLANVIGTTGASMLLIRPVLRINRDRLHNRHVPVFFIFAVSNLGGLLTPLGDPPLFLGFLEGVDFFWTLSLWPVWLVGVGSVLAVFCLWDAVRWRHEPPIPAPTAEDTLRVRGLINVLFLAGILAAVLLQSEKVAGGWTLERPWPALVMLAMAGLSLLATPGKLRAANDFSWGAMIEVAVLFAGIFVTMVPALELLKHPPAGFRLTGPAEYFWLTGLLSAVLDNAPTYMTFATFAAGDRTLAELMTAEPLILQAISAGAVFMGAMTYIGNGPNFMVKAIAEEAGYRMPTFFGYLGYSTLVLLPIFVLVTTLFFW